MSAQTTSATASTSSRPPITLGHNTHLDPGAYARGTHAISLADNILVHPRAQLVAVHGPLSIGDRCIISEKCIIGGPVPSSTDTTAKSSSAPSAVGSNPPTPLLEQPGDGDDEHDPVKTTIGQNVYIHASSQVHAGAMIGDGVLVEPHVTILANITVNAHAKICAGVTVDRDVEKWSVVYGNGDIKRRRKKQSPSAGERDDNVELVETLRLKTMDKEREGTVALFRTAARMAAALKKK
jgi:acetyltransferase-like isoleucine patch superfamily enzyme